MAGALPQNPAGPLDHASAYSVESLLPLYIESAVVLRRGKIEKLAPLTEPEEVDIPGLGRLEARLTGGTRSTCPYSFHTRLASYEHKTLRYPGHFEKMAALLAMGFLNDKPVDVDGRRVAPRELFVALAQKAWSHLDEKDLVVLRVCARGKRHGRVTEVSYTLVDRFEPSTGFSALERVTAAAASSALGLQVRGRLRAGAEPLELALPYREYVPELRKRGLKIVESQRTLASAT